MTTERIVASSSMNEVHSAAAVDRAGKSLRDLRIAEVVDQDLQIQDGKITAYRVKLKMSFKFED